jgi:hypothetical protein
VTAGVECDAIADVAVVATEAGRVDECGSRRVELRDEGVRIGERATRRGLERSCGCREVGGSSHARQVGVAGAVHLDVATFVGIVSAQMRGVDEPGAGRVQLRDESVFDPAAIRWLERARGRWEVGRLVPAGEVRVACGVDRDPASLVESATPHVRRVDERGAGRVELGSECIRTAVVGRVECTGSGRKTSVGEARDVCITGAVDRDPFADGASRTPEEGGVHECRAGWVQLRHKCARDPAEDRLKRTGGRREVRRARRARHVCVASRINRDPEALVETVPAEVRRVDERGIDDERPARVVAAAERKAIFVPGSSPSQHVAALHRHPRPVNLLIGQRPRVGERAEGCLE